MRVVFQRYDVEPSAWAVVRWARETGLTFPTRRPLRGRGRWGGVETPRGLALARYAQEPGLRRRVRVRPPAREAGARRRTDSPRASRHARSGAVAGEDRGRASGLHHVGALPAKPGEAATEHGPDGPPESRRAARRPGPVERAAGVRALRPAHGTGVRARGAPLGCGRTSVAAIATRASRGAGRCPAARIDQAVEAAVSGHDGAGRARAVVGRGSRGRGPSGGAGDSSGAPAASRPRTRRVGPRSATRP